MSSRMMKYLQVNCQTRRTDQQPPVRQPTDRLGQPGSIPALLQPSGGMAVRRRKGATAEPKAGKFFSSVVC
ncbi:hypothetical protein T265_11335 [Opisthorchis viverrini]|uniref:Uncharacterized protein n=1 Tax=Opisthorchis viverrini TaxID=6198 RepID=A0A074Z9U6_OPIVI|nr:hypothetical protein T265_11335 [Opisthorchis viverrini]KER20015.1 hypothetical protein T265_11335 [Opisthorchis viverrini]